MVALTDAIESLERQLQTETKRLTPEPLDRFRRQEL